MIGIHVARAFEQHLRKRGAHEEAVWGDRNIPAGTEIGYAAERAAELTDNYRDIPAGIPYLSSEFNAGDATVPRLSAGDAHAVAIYYGLSSPVAIHRKRTLQHVEKFRDTDMSAELKRAYKRAGSGKSGYMTPEYKERMKRDIAGYVSPLV